MPLGNPEIQQQPKERSERAELLGEDVDQAVAKAVQSAATKSETLDQDIQAALDAMIEKGFATAQTTIEPQSVRAFNKTALTGRDEEAREAGIALNTLLAAKNSVNLRPQ